MVAVSGGVEVGKTLRSVACYGMAGAVSGFFWAIDCAMWMAPNYGGWPANLVGGFLTALLVPGTVALFWFTYWLTGEFDE